LDVSSNFEETVKCENRAAVLSDLFGALNCGIYVFEGNNVDRNRSEVMEQRGIGRAAVQIDARVNRRFCPHIAAHRLPGKMFDGLCILSL
jgi:hypothetical protein